MSKDFKNKPAPKLRFKEFENSGAWDINNFSAYIVLYRGSSPRPIQNYLTKESSGVNWIKIGDTKVANNFIISQVEERITPEGAEKSRKVEAGELILANSMSFGKTYQLAIDGYIHDGWFVLREYEQNFKTQFLLQILNSEYMQNQYKKFSAGGIVQNISSDIVYKTLLPHTLPAEQQKIADCLSSLDDLITAENQKLETLKAHKKGLMQNLFPAEGETAPNIRFPEFSEGWKKAKLKDVSLYFNGGSYENDVKGEGKYELITLKSINTNGKLVNSKRYVEIEVPTLTKGTLVMILSEQAPGLLGMTAIIPTDDKYVLNQRVAEIRPNQKVESYFLSMAINRNQNYFSKHGAGTKVQNISKPNVENYEFLLPEILEQQKIASCLSSLDEQIETQSQKIETLKLHKKGLMQGLFPNVNEVSLPNSLSLESVRN
jgi:type I restriction enzyme S subunit